MARRAGGRRPPALLAVPATVVAGAALVPVAYLAVRAGESGLGRVADTLLQGRTAALAARSLALAAAVTAAAVTLGIALAWTTERCRLPGGRLWQVLAALPLAVPTYVAGFAFVSRFPWLAGFLGAWLVLTLCSYPYVYLPVAAALRGLDGTLEEVARSLGRSRAATFWHVTLPQLRPAAAAGALLVGLYALSDFGAVSLLRFTAFTRAIYLSYQASFDRTPAAVLGCVLVGLTALLVAVEVRTRGRARYSRPGGGAARRVPPRPAGGPWRWAPVLLPAAVAALALGVPAAAPVTWPGRGVADATLARHPRRARGGHAPPGAAGGRRGRADRRRVGRHRPGRPRGAGCSRRAPCPRSAQSPNQPPAVDSLARPPTRSVPPGVTWNGRRPWVTGPGRGGA